MITRYIDVDKAIQRLREKCVTKYPTSFYCGILASANEIDKLPTADVEEVVRCKECKYHNKAPCPMLLSFKWTNDNDFCSYGERRDK